MLQFRSNKLSTYTLVYIPTHALGRGGQVDRRAEPFTTRNDSRALCGSFRDRGSAAASGCLWRDPHGNAGDRPAVDPVTCPPSLQLRMREAASAACREATRRAASSAAGPHGCRSFARLLHAGDAGSERCSLSGGRVVLVHASCRCSFLRTGCDAPVERGSDSAQGGDARGKSRTSGGGFVGYQRVIAAACVLASWAATRPALLQLSLTALP